MNFNLSYTFDVNLREVLENPNEVEEYVQSLLIKIDSAANDIERSKILGEAGVFLRMLGQLKEAQKCLEQSNEILGSIPQSRWHCIQQIRLAHVYQWQKDFDRSNAIFNKLLDCEAENELFDFVLQHAGKNYFDQQRYQEALVAFEKTLSLRQKKNSPKDQIESTQKSIVETQRRIDSSNKF